MVLTQFFARCLRVLAGKGNTIRIREAHFAAIPRAATHFEAIALPVDELCDMGARAHCCPFEAGHARDRCPHS
jgi:hypothetical protein